ncbi:MAG: hypothetical protein KAT35_03390, partial [Candidatus Aenigmarchaeota archaeon]|nr:hypothetical protein [Candidatus Aenigmarchaeota archaeon]
MRNNPSPDENLPGKGNQATPSGDTSATKRPETVAPESAKPAENSSPASNELGTVVSSMEGPSTRKFSFVINIGVMVRRGQFIQLRTEEGELIGRVSDVYKTNRYFMRPES